ncbi:Leucine-rich repeat-containing protein 47 [Halotydeus destructor]|nr:Leucine-rich repeat-containing protein 47 [Halotydeus destructor]
MVNWSELVQQKPHELVLTGKSGADQVKSDDGLNEICFKISSLNFLEVSGSGLSSLSPNIEKLANLTNLVLQGNSLKEVPVAIGKLTKLKFIDVARNQIERLPDEINNLTNLQSLIVSDNKLEALPSDLSNLVNLIVVKFDQNNFSEFPLSLVEGGDPKVQLTEIHGHKNKITAVPGQINRLTTLKLLDLRENSITVVAGEIGDCAKLKDVLLAGNKLADRRLLKLVDQNKSKQVIDYIRANCPKGSANLKGGKSGRDTSADRRLRLKDSRERRRSGSRSRENSESFMDTIKILPVKEGEWRTVTATPMVLDQRKAVACLVRNVNLRKNDNVLKKFISYQTDLHNGICGRRTLATIAVHDLDKIQGNITFDVKPPGKLKIVPLNRTKEMTATELYQTLNDEAELLRKEKKRNTYSGVHKYLHLLKGKARFPCLYDSTGTVISFPPITNSETTRLSLETRNLFIEVTGESTPMCKKVLDALLHGMVKMKLGDTTLWPKLSEAEPTGDGIAKPSLLEVEPMRVVDGEGKLLVAYPARPDLVFEDVNVLRNS